jgi:cysteine desulfurase
MPTIYLDNNATTRPAPQVVEAMNECLNELWANPSSIHRAGQAVRRKLDLARQCTAQLVGCSERDLIFTSGGTEAANLAILGSLRVFSMGGNNKRVFVTTRIEHSAVRESAKRLADDGYEVVWLSNDDDGVIDLNALEDLVKKRASEIALVAVMWCNNETGVIQPIERISALCHQHGVRFYADGTQWVGKMPTNVATLPLDLLSFAAHKFHGPKGAGALYVKPRTKLAPTAIGGPQERQRRGGTENVAGIVGMGVACELALKWFQTDGRARIEAMRDRLERQLLHDIEGAAVNGATAAKGRIWNTSNIGFPGAETEAILMLLSERGVCASGGSACASGSLDPSPVLQAMRVPAERAHGSVRFSLSRETTDAEVDSALEIIPTVVNRLRNSVTAAAPHA